MAMRVWDPFNTLATRDARFVPAELDRDGTDVVLTLELPGVDPEQDVEVEVAERRLVVSGERRRHGRFRRSFTLPEHVTGDDVEAAYEHGLLTVRVRGVHREVPEPRKITVRSGSVRQVEAGEQQAA